MQVFALDDLTEKLGALNKLAQKQIHQVCWKASYLSVLLFFKIAGMKMGVQNVKNNKNAVGHEEEAGDQRVSIYF